MHSAWTKGTSGPSRATRKKEVLDFRNAFDELRPLVEALQKKPQEADYESPSWAYHQADTNGYNRALTKVLDLIDLNGRKPKD
jgi:hypothetical protein